MTRKIALICPKTGIKTGEIELARRHDGISLDEIDLHRDYGIVDVISDEAREIYGDYRKMERFFVSCGGEKPEFHLFLSDCDRDMRKLFRKMFIFFEDSIMKAGIAKYLPAAKEESDNFVANFTEKNKDTLKNTVKELKQENKDLLKDYADLDKLMTKVIKEMKKKLGE